MMKQFYVLLVAMLAAIAHSSCEHKELCFDHTHVHNVKVVFDWRNAPDANPATVSAYFFSVARGDGDEEGLRYNFIGRDGGNIRLMSGSYSAIGMNNDHTDWARFRGTNDIETFEIYTFDAITLSALGLDIYNLPRSRDVEDERFAQTPGMLWNHRVDGIAFDDDDGDQTITFYPEEAVCHYTVTILNVENLKYLNGGALDATLSGLAEGFYHGSHSPTDTPVTMPFEIADNGTGTQLFGKFLNFGIPSHGLHKHILTVYTLYEDGSAIYFNFDVTDQVVNAPDPRHVDIVIDGLYLPKPITNGGGLKPSVEDWNEVNVDLNM